MESHISHEVVYTKEHRNDILDGVVVTNPKGVKSSDVEARYKIVMVGSSGSGKTSLLLRYADNIFNESVQCTLSVDQKSKLLKVDDRIVKIQIWDTAGQERYKSLSKAYLRGAHGCIAVYDITSAQSFDELKQ